MNKILISTEATCDLTKELKKKYGIYMIDMNYYIDGEEYNTGKVSLEDSNLYSKMRGNANVGTSQINYQTYNEYFKDLLNKGEIIIHICFSTGLSGTYNSCKLVIDQINKDLGKTRIIIIDSLCACSGLGLLSCLAAIKRDEGYSAKQIVDYIELIKLNLNHSFTVDDLKYLANGGRISKGSAQIGNILNIKPVMKMNDEGKLVVNYKVISRRKAIFSLADELKNRFNGQSNIVYISHADCLEDAKLLKERILLYNKELEIEIMDLGPIIGSHSGPGTLAVYYLGNNR